MDALGSPPEPGAPNYLSALYAYVTSNASGPIDRHVFTCIVFCFMGHGHGQANHLLLRTLKEDIPKLRQMVLDILCHVFGLTTRSLRLKDTSTAESVVSDLLQVASSVSTSSLRPPTRSRSTKSSLQVLRTPTSPSRPTSYHLKPEARARSLSGRDGTSSQTRHPSLSTRPSTASTSGNGNTEATPRPVVPEALVVTSLGRASHDTQESLWDILRHGYIKMTETLYPLPEHFFLVAVHDVADGKDRPDIATCMLDRFAFSSYIDFNTPASPKPALRRPTPVLTAEYIETLAHHPLPTVSPHLDVYLGNLLVATAQHALLAAVFGTRTRAAFHHFTRASAALFLVDDGAGPVYATQNDAARVYVHVVGHRLSVRYVGETVTGILDRTAVMTLDSENRRWIPGIKRRETVAQIMREILSVV